MYMSSNKCYYSFCNTSRFYKTKQTFILLIDFMSLGNWLNEVYVPNFVDIDKCQYVYVRRKSKKMLSNRDSPMKVGSTDN